VARVADSLDLMVERLTDVETAWSVGTFGAIAEFSRDAAEAAIQNSNAKATWVVTARGGVRVEAHEGMRPIATESLTAQSWNQRVAFCLPESACAMSGRTVLTEIGRDQDALREEDRGALLFDLGLGTLQLDACVRTGDAALIVELQRWVGQSLFASGNGALAAILAVNPHRVFLSRVGRVEVFQPIPPPDGKSPDGPHTHVLPRLLRHNRTHAATESLPQGWIPCAHFYPPHPARNALGQSHAFRTDRHTAFQKLLGRYGDQHAIDVKRRIEEAVAAGKPPSCIATPADRFARATVRIALRQLRASAPNSRVLPAWLSVHDHFEPDELNDSVGEHPCTG
jgi:hypothetical protein